MSLGRPPAFPVGLVSLPRAQDPRNRTRLWWIIAIAAIALNLVTTARVGATATQPAFPFDELHLLQLARLLAGDPMPEFGSGGYFPAWGILLTPLWWIFDEPEQVYAAAAIVGWVLAAATIWPLALLVRRVRLDLPQALTVAAVVSTLPSRTVQADYVLSERLLFLVVVLTALAAFRLWERTTFTRAVVFGLAAAAVYFTHMRMLPVVLASGVWLAALLLKRWPVALAGLVTLGAGYVLAEKIGDRLNDVLLEGETGQSEGVLRNLEDFHLGFFVRVALGQTWNQIIGSYGLVAIGFIAIVVWAWREVRRRRLGRASWLFGVFTASWLLSVIAWASDWNLWENPWRRLDAWIYGRYLDPVAALVVAIGLAVLVRGIRTVTWAWATAGAVAILAPVVFWLAPQAPTWGWVTPAHMGGVLPWGFLLPHEVFPPGIVPSFTNENRFWLWASLSVLACLVAYRLLRRWAIAAPIGLLVLAVAGSAGANDWSDDFRGLEQFDPAAIASVEQIVDESGETVVGYDFSCGRPGTLPGVPFNKLAWGLMPDALVKRVDSNGEVPTMDIVVSCIGDSPLAAYGAAELDGPEFYYSRIWIMPGALQDELRERGRLVE
ncbi:hypothetical protein [Microbacterium rhizophilus]|uniref:hypothetical protein n=1 Tax=Microbacterium rhizophilus TaxID=3138934 RepID=UPI0031EF9BB2